MPRILIVDTYYPDFLKSWPFNPAGSYDSELKRLLEFSFGTGDFYSRTLKFMGWETQDYIANAPLEGVHWIEPDVIFMQDLSISPPIGFEDTCLAGQLSCPWPGNDKVRRYDVIFTSFPHYIDRIQKLDVRAVYNPLAFDPIVLERAERSIGLATRERIHDCVFIGGVGNPSHWKRGMETLEYVAREIPTFKWWGYGYDTLNTNSPLRKCYQGEAYGLDMYRILLQSKIVLNRHGEVAEGYTNNMRCFEATGCGAVLVTERSKNLHDFFTSTEAVAYSGPEEAVYAIRGLLRNEPLRKQIAENGQSRTLRDHTYAERMKVVSSTLMRMLDLCPIHEVALKDGRCMCCFADQESAECAAYEKENQ